MSKKYCWGHLVKIVFIFCVFFLQTNKMFAENDMDLYKKAQGYLQEGQGELAYLKFNRIVEMYPKSQHHDEALFRIAEYNFKKNNCRNAEIYLRRHASLYPNSHFEKDSKQYLSIIIKKKADEAFQRRNFREAVKLYEERNKQVVSNQEVDDRIKECRKNISMGLVNQADALYLEGRWRRAMSLYQEAFEEYPEEVDTEYKINKCREQITKEHEVLAFKEEQKEKGLVFFDGEWMTVEEIERLNEDLKERLTFDYERTLVEEFIEEEKISPKNIAVLKEKNYRKSFNEVWATILLFFSSNNLPIATLEKDSGYISMRTSLEETTSMTDFIDTGFIQKKKSLKETRFLCPNFSLSQSSQASYDMDTVMSLCQPVAVETRVVETQRKKIELSGDALVVDFNVFVRQMPRRGVRVMVNMSYKSLGNNVVASSGLFEKMLFVFIDENLNK